MIALTHIGYISYLLPHTCDAYWVAIYIYVCIYTCIYFSYMHRYIYTHMHVAIYKICI